MEAPRYEVHVKTPPNELPVSLAEAKVQCSIDADDPTWDAQFNSVWLPAATGHAEDFTRRAFITQTLRYSAGRFPLWMLTLPRPELQAVLSIEYVDYAGALQTLLSSRYQVDLDSGSVWPAINEVWPTTRWQPGAVKIEFQAGYGNAAAVPAPIKQAILQCAAHYYEHRAATISGTIIAQVPLGFHDALYPCRVVNF